MYVFLGLSSIAKELFTILLIGGNFKYLKKRKIGLAQGVTWGLAVKGLNVKNSHTATALLKAIDPWKIALDNKERKHGLCFPRSSQSL